MPMVTHMRLVTCDVRHATATFLLQIYFLKLFTHLRRATCDRYKIAFIATENVPGASKTRQVLNGRTYHRLVVLSVRNVDRLYHNMGYFYITTALLAAISHSLSQAICLFVKVW